jgi:DNA-binding transcriptional LysR family regulator
MRFKGLDLNLLVALDALLETRSVSRAAERLYLSQPAVSAALSRLRDYFGDEILVTTGKRMYPTAFAESVLPELRQCFGVLDALVSSSTVFDPKTSHRRFVIVGSDYITSAVLAPMIARLATEAPSIRVEIVAPSDESAESLAAGKVDLVLTPEQFVQTDHPAELLFQEQHVVVGWSGNPLLADGRISEEDFLDSGHIGVSFGRLRTPSFADRQMALMGKSRRIEVISPSFATVPWLLKGTHRLALMHERLAKTMSEFFPIATAPAPFDFPLMNEMIQHHRARSRDEGLMWLKAQLAQEALCQSRD